MSGAALCRQKALYRSEEPHLEDTLVGNGARKNGDLLFVIDLKGGGVHEQGMMSRERDETLVRHLPVAHRSCVEPITGKMRFAAPPALKIATSVC